VLDGSVFAVGNAGGTIDEMQPSGRLDVYVRVMDPTDGKRVSIELFGTPDKDAVFDTASDGSTIVLTGFTCGEGQGERRRALCDIFTMHLTRWLDI
jgi:hypothetical protein